MSDDPETPDGAPGGERPKGRSPERAQMRRMVSSNEVRERISRRIGERPHGHKHALIEVGNLLSRLGVRVEQVQAALLSADAAFTRQLTEAMLKLDVSYAAFYRDMVKPMTNSLGDGWRDDRLNIVDIEMASSRLSLWCEQYANALSNERDEAHAVPRRILLAHMRGDQHTLGILILSHCFRDAGWEVEGGPGCELGPELEHRIARAPFDVVGLSLGLPIAHNDCTALIENLRSKSRSDEIRIGLGGAVVAADPSRFAQIGADFIAADALEAVEACERLLKQA